MKISYAIAAYFGERQTPSKHLLDDPLFYVKEQLIGINKSNTNISKIYIICTFGENVHSEEIMNYLHELKNTDDRIFLSVRENLGGSYCSWQNALWEDNGNSDYVFLVEDDYALDDKNGIEFVIQNYFKKDLDLFYLCQLWSKKVYNTFGDDILEHASMSCGIINNKLYDRYRKEFNIDFRLVHESGYKSMWKNQSCFLENHRQLGMKFLDWTDTCSSYFYQSDIEYGKKDGVKVLKSLI